MEELSLSSGDEQLLQRLCSRVRPSLPGAPPRSQREGVWTRRWRFPDAASAGAWTDAWERSAISRTSPAVLLEEGGAPIADPVRAFVAGVAASALRSELERGTPAPEALAGGALELRIAHVYSAPPIPGTEPSLVLDLRWSVIDAEGRVRWSIECARAYDLKRIPASAPMLLTSSLSELSEETYAPPARPAS
jgi:hypothetical protein